MKLEENESGGNDRTMNFVGYLVKRPDGLYGERGLYYDYVLASNGVFIEAEGSLLAARVPVAHAQIRGLAPLKPMVVLRHGLIPQRHFDLALSAMMVDTSRERYVAVTWNDGYHLYIPEQEGTGGGVEYQVGDNVVFDLHSHGRMAPFFSTTDNKDEQGLKLYGVVGKLDKTPEVRLRVGVYGYHHPISWGDAFEGSLYGVEDALFAETEREEKEKEVSIDDLCGLEPGVESQLGHRISWLRWDRWFRRGRAL